jgi:glycerate 2-kinase
MRHPIENPAAADREVLSGIFDAALAAADPCQAVLNAVRVDGDSLLAGGARYDLASFERIVVVGAGKATARMAQAAETLLGSRISAGLIVVKDGHTGPLKIIEQVEASHPVPNQAGIAGTQRLLQLVRDADEKTLVLCLLSGGASALLVAPVDHLTLQDKQHTTQLLLNAGASINELNAVRKHLSAVKGGGLARAAYPAQLLTLIVSDVIGDPLDVIGSGPTSADVSTYAEAAAVIEKYGLQQRLPPRVAEHLRRGRAGQQPETVKAGDPCLATTRNVIVAGIRQALAAAEIKAEQLGFATVMISAELQGEARDAAAFLAQSARGELGTMQAGERRCLLSGGETTVTVRGNGMGGRNQELALAFALETEGWDGVSLLSAGTDGSDGPNDAAGAVVDGTTAARARSLDIDPAAYLGNNDSYTFFRELDAAAGTHSHFKTGPTGTNVMDIQILLLAK